MTEPIEDPDVATGVAPASGVDLDYEPTGTAEPDPEDDEDETPGS